MYLEYEKPTITCSLFYYDREYKKEVGEHVMDILEKHNMFPPEKFYAGKLTKNRFVYATEHTKDVMAQAYSEKDVLGLDMASGDSRKVTDFFECMKELIILLHPFYASIDDVSNKVKLMDLARETHFVPERIQEIYWGNYFGEEHFNHYGMEKMKNIPAKNVERIGNGVFFSLTDHILEFESKECKKRRKTVKSYLK